MQRSGFPGLKVIRDLMTGGLFIKREMNYETSNLGKHPRLFLCFSSS
jgi:hypothetical protein